MNGRIAVHYFGHTRTYASCIPTHFQFLYSQNYEYSIFMHTWDESDRRTPSWYEAPPSRKICSNEIERVQSMLQPQRMFVEKQIIDRESLEVPYISSRKMHESLRKSIQIRLSADSEKNYDMVMVIRPDAMLHKMFPLDELSKLTRDPLFRHSIFSSTYNHKANGIFQTDRMGARDCIFIGAPSSMNQFSLIGRDGSIYQKHIMQNGTGEIFFDNFLRRQNLAWHPIEYTAPDDWEIFREIVTEANRTF